MVGPLGALPAGPTVFATEFEDDVDAGPLGSLSAGLAVSTTKFEMTLMAGPLGGAVGRSGSIRH
jgi:hypothetical protein